MSKVRQRKNDRKIPMMALLSGSIAAILLINIILTNLGYSLFLQKRYVQEVKTQLTDACEEILDTGFDPDTLDAIEDNGIILFVYSTDSSKVLFDSREHSAADLSGQANVNSTPKPNGRQKASIHQILEQIGQNLQDQNGSFFSDSAVNPDTPEDTSRQITLYGKQDGIYFSLSCIVAPLNTALSLAFRFASVTSLGVWFISFLVVLIISRRVVDAAKETSNTAQKIASLDFSKRCSPMITREMNSVAESINSMSDQLQDNISQLQNANNHLKGELSERQKQQKLNTELISNLSHDLKTPLAIISGYAEGLNDGIAKTPEQVERYSNVIFKETEHMQVIVSKMLALSRLEAGETPLLPVFFDVAELVRDIVQSFRLEIEKTQLNIVFQGETSLKVCSDYECIRQVLINYIQNSVYHINGGSKIRIRLTKLAHCGEIAIANSSAPLSAQTSEQIWNKLYRGDRARQRKHGEVGLGLSIVKGNMERLGQPYGVRNLEGEAMVEFYIRLPLADAEKEESL